MSDIQLSKEHKLGKERCLELAKELAEKLESRLGGSSKVDGDKVYYSHMGAKGTLEAGECNIDIQVKLNMMARAFKPQIEQEIQRLFDKYID